MLHNLLKAVISPIGKQLLKEILNHFSRKNKYKNNKSVRIVKNKLKKKVSKTRSLSPPLRSKIVLKKGHKTQQTSTLENKNKLRA